MSVEIHNAFLSLLKNAMFDATSSYNCIVPKNDNVSISQYSEKNKAVALSYANSALSYCCAARALYYANLDKLEHAELPELFHLFGVYVHEVQKNYKENHSHQWTNIEFERLQETFLKSVGVEPITP